MIIGVFKSQADPLKIFPPERSYAMAAVAKMEGIELVFFNSQGVDLENKTITGWVREEGKWIKKTTKFPSAIINQNPGNIKNRTTAEKVLRENIPFTSRLIGNKKMVEDLLKKSNEFKTLVIKSERLHSIDTLFLYLNEHGKIVLKPVNGSQGRGIYYIEECSGKYIFLNHTEKKIYNKEELIGFTNELLNKGYVIQPYIQATTSTNNPFDFRVHVQKNGEGVWQVTKIYPRVGDSSSILSNVSRGGVVAELNHFMLVEFNEKSGEYIQKLTNLGIDIAKYLEKSYGYKLDELGIDLTIDHNNEFWLYEVNTSPQTKFHEWERAKNTIAYAKFLAEIKIKSDARKSKPIIGMLSDSRYSNSLKLASASLAKAYGVEFCFFSYRDLNVESKTVRAYFYENGQWIKQNISYEKDIDVIIDRLRMRGRKGYEKVYNELGKIPFNNNLYGNSISKLKLYEKLEEFGFSEEYTIPYNKVENIETVREYLTKYTHIILKPSVGSFGQGIVYLKKINPDEYVRIIDSVETNLNSNELEDYITELLNKKTLIVQKYINTRTIDHQPFDIRVHMMKNGENKWSFANIYPRIGINKTRIVATGQGGYIGALQGFLKRNFSTKMVPSITNEIKEMSIKVGDILEEIYDKELSEVGIDIAIDTDGSLYLIEANLNKPGIIYYDFEIAKHLIPYAIYLANKDNKENSK